MNGAADRRFAAAAWLCSEPLAGLLAVLDRDGEEARVVGGAVRNALMGRAVGEIDIATTAVPDEVVRRVTQAGFKAVPTGIEHGTVIVLAQGIPFEVTTLRRDVETDGRHARVAFGRDWRVDAERRDFTINALSVSADGALHDPIGGRTDIEARRVRFIGDPARRIAEDALRILRFFRFHAAFGEGEPDAAGVSACIAGRAGLTRLSRERVRMEMFKLIAAPRAAPVLVTMSEAGLLVSVLGGVPLIASLDRMVGIEVALGLAPDPVRRLGALAVQVAEDAVRLGERWRLSGVESERLLSMADGWRDVALGDERAGRALLYRLGPVRFTDRVLLAFARSAVPADDARWLAQGTLPERWTAPAFPLKAADFITRGFEKGPPLGKALRAAEAAWIAADFSDDRTALDQIADAAAETARRT